MLEVLFDIPTLKKLYPELNRCFGFTYDDISGEYCGSTTLSALVLSIGRSAGINFVLRIIDIRNLQYAGTQS